MSDVKRYRASTAEEETQFNQKLSSSFVLAADFDAAQAELVALREAYVAAGEREHALREELAQAKEVIGLKDRDLIEAQTAVTGWAAKCKAAEQRNAEPERDKIRIDWLIEQPVDTLYLDDGRIIDIAGRVDLRDAIDEAMAKPVETGEDE